MVSFNTIIIICFFFFFWVAGATDYGDHLVFGSWKGEDILASSTFKHNLDSALQNLRNLSSFTRYAISTIGSGEDKVHAMFQCREDLSPLGCMQCLDTAIATVLLPPFSPFNAPASKIQLNACYFRYDNSTSFTERPRFKYAHKACIALESKALVDKAISLAPRNGGYYAVAPGSTGHVAIAECLGYLSQMECAQCLSDAASFSDGASLSACPSQL